MPDIVKVLCVGVVAYERRKLEVALGIRVGCRRNVPDLDFPPQSDHKVPPRWREGESRHFRLEGEVVEHNAPRDVGQHGLAIFVDREQEIALRGQADPRDVLSVCKGEGVGLVTGSQSAHIKVAF